MAEFPALEVTASGPHGPPEGTRIALSRQPFLIGRAKGADLQINSNPCGRRHCEVVFEHQRWWVRDLGSTHGTFVRGERIHDAQLLHRDCFELPGGICFRILLHQSSESHSPLMEETLVKHPDDEHSWAVYADWLLEHGNPLGERLVNPSAADNGRWLGPLALATAEGDLEVTWAHGLPSRVVLRQLSPWGARMFAPLRLEVLVRAQEFHFVRSLEFDVSSLTLTHNGWADQILRRVGAHSLPFLEQMILGPTSWAPAAALAEGHKILGERRSKYPHFVTTPLTLMRAWRPASLTIDGHTIGLSPRDTFRAHGEPSLGASCPNFNLSFVDDRWLLRSDEKEVRVNGIPCSAALLRPGDVLEPIPNKRLHFNA